jgi:hypothetical protein
VDLNDEDQPLAGQKFVCVSFISPEKIIKSREEFLFQKFVDQWDLTKSIKKFNDFMQFLAFKYHLKHDDLYADFAAFLDDQKNVLRELESVSNEYKSFLDDREEALNEEYNRQNQFQTSTRGLKIRGVFNTQEEAEMRCKKLREIDPNHDIYVGPVGMWIPFDPDAYKTGRVEFLEDELNQLHHEKIKNETEAKMAFEARRKEMTRQAIEENVRKARESGNKLTQTLSPEGDLVGVKETVNFDDREVADEDGIRQHTEEVTKRAEDAAAATAAI